MLSTNCFCGFEIAGNDRDAQVAAGHAHFTEAHAEIGVTLQGMRNFLEREEMLTGSTERLESLGGVEIVDLAPERIDDVLAFFDRDAFADFPAWGACYCMAHHIEGGWGDRSWQQNRDEIKARVESGATTGALAYVDGKLAGWCNASVREEYPGYRRGDDDGRIGVVACFVMAPPYRGHGLARRLLDGAVEQFKRRGMIAVEGYCANETDNNPQAAYRGTIPLYESAGFSAVHRGDRTTVMRKEL